MSYRHHYYDDYSQEPSEPLFKNKTLNFIAQFILVVLLLVVALLACSLIPLFICVSYIADEKKIKMVNFNDSWYKKIKFYILSQLSYMLMSVTDQKIYYKKITDKFTSACSTGEIEKIKFLLTSNLFPFKIDINNNYPVSDKDFNGFTVACMEGNLEVVKYLLTSKDLPKNVDLRDENNSACLLACAANGKLEIIKYLLTSPELKQHADINYDGGGLATAILLNQLEIVQYLTLSTDLKQHADIYWNNGMNLVAASELEDMRILHFLLYDLNFKLKPEHLKKLSIDLDDDDKYNYVISLIEKRDLYVQLNSQLPEKKEKSQNKI